MLGPTCLARVILGMVVSTRLTAGVATAQTPNPQAAGGPAAAVVTAGVTVGDVVHVTDATGATIKGRLAALPSDALEVRINGSVRRVAASQVRRIRWQQRDSVLTGVLVGAAIGAVPGIYWLIADPNECAGLCPEEYALVAAGAAIGGLVDRAMKRKVTVYSAESPRGMSVAVVPLAAPRRMGVQVGLRF